MYWVFLAVLCVLFAGLCPFVILALSVFFCNAPAWRNPSGGWWGWPSWGVSGGTLGAPFAHNCDLLAKWNTCMARGSTGSNSFWFFLKQLTKEKVQRGLQRYEGRKWLKGSSKISFWKWEKYLQTWTPQHKHERTLRAFLFSSYLGLQSQIWGQPSGVNGTKSYYFCFYHIPRAHKIVSIVALIVL